MLKSLHIRNFALIDQVDIEFNQGLNVITGETGAGKSILIDALGSTLGEKIDEDMLRSKEEKAIVECVFSIGNLLEVKDQMKASEIDNSDNALILRKEVLQTGRNRAFVNDTPMPANSLLTFGDLLVDLHGQHQHQALLKVKYHLHYLDEFGGYHDLLNGVQQCFQKVTALMNELEEMQRKEKSLKEKKEIYQFQLQEIAATNPYAGEEDELVQEEKILRNSEKLFQLTNDLYLGLYESEGSVSEIISESCEKLDDLVLIDAQFEAYKKDAQSARIIIDEIAKFVQSYNSNITFDPQRLEDIRERLAQFSRLKKKYANTIEGILTYKAEIEKELALIESLDEKIAKKQEEIRSEKVVLTELCSALSQKRTSTAQVLQESIEQSLTELGMPDAKFKIIIQQIEDPAGFVTIENKYYKTSVYGIDFVEFLISANAGEEPKPLVKVASGGEVSRIMLAIKTAMAEADRIPVLIFDEIDIGISGRIAQAVGKSLRKLSQTHQVICITHLPQIASMGDHHYVVEKFSDNNRTYTTIRKLKSEEQALEVAKLLGGDKISEIQIQSAQELIAQVKENKI